MITKDDQYIKVKVRMSTQEIMLIVITKEKTWVNLIKDFVSKP